jgi:hypothetical protein
MRLSVAGTLSRVAKASAIILDYRLAYHVQTVHVLYYLCSRIFVC